MKFLKLFGSIFPEKLGESAESEIAWKGCEFFAPSPWVESTEDLIIFDGREPM